ncbi:MAG TPA: alpha/beta fold hydrolase [Pyrinomonadaceae bacterium]|nr:alpha/beta fold hydrolase [Pyrinomonadaceae bacterium]
MSANLLIHVNERESVTALLYAAAKRDRSRITLILGHGAGANQLSGFMREFGNGLGKRGLDVVTFNFLYMEQGRKIPDPAPRLESCYRAVIDAMLTHKKLKGNHLVIGGKSMGGRIASQVAASHPENIDGLVFLGYPLHPPGRPDKMRSEHLPKIKAPMLFVQGARDAFGTKQEIAEIIKKLKLRAELYAIEGGDHSFKVPKTLGVSQAEVHNTAMDRIGDWLRKTLR